MSRLTLPDYIFDSFSEVTSEFLCGLGICALLVDIDNTLASYEEAEPNERVKMWVEELRRNGINLALISNNNRKRVEHFNRELGLVAFHHSGKPFSRKLRAAMKLLGSNKENTAVLGDQLMTDAVAGKKNGLKTIIVPPINDRKSAFFRFKRALEVPTIKKYVKLHADDDCGACSFWILGGYKKKNRKQRK